MGRERDSAKFSYWRNHQWRQCRLETSESTLAFIQSLHLAGLLKPIFSPRFKEKERDCSLSFCCSQRILYDQERKKPTTA